MAKESFLLFTDHLQLVEELSDEQAGKLMKGVLRYASGDDGVVFSDGITRVVFKAIKTSIDRANEKYERICQRNRDNGKKGGRPKIENPDEPKKPTGLSGNPKNPDEPRRTLPDRDRDREEVIESINILSCPNSSDDSGAKKFCDNVPHEKIVALYHELLPELRRMIKWTPQRQKLLRARWREDRERQSLEWWKNYFNLVGESPFLMGVGPDGRNEFQADLEWLIRPQNIVKVLERKYH